VGGADGAHPRPVAGERAAGERPAQLDPAQLDAVQLDAAQLDAAQLDAAQLDAARTARSAGGPGGWIGHDCSVALLVGPCAWRSGGRQTRQAGHGPADLRRLTQTSTA
jgi:hypothetical protein